MGLKPHSRHLVFFKASDIKDDCRRLVIHGDYAQNPRSRAKKRRKLNENAWLH
jgi:hypothetical protein